MHYIKTSFLFFLISTSGLCASVQRNFFDAQENEIIRGLFSPQNYLAENDIKNQLRNILTYQNKINFCDQNGQTCLHKACSFAKPNVIRWLINNGAVSSPDNNGSHPIHLITHKSIFNVFFDVRFNINVKNAANETLLDLTCKKMRTILIDNQLDQHLENYKQLREFGCYIKRFGAKKAHQLS